MKQTFFLSIVVVSLLRTAVVQGQAAGTLQGISCASVQAISFDISIPDLDEWSNADAALWAVNGKADASCQPTFDNGGNGLVSYAAFDVETCADEPTVSADGTKLIYEFVIDVDAPTPAPGDPPVIYAYDHQYSVKCYYNRQQDNLMASFEPLNVLSDDGSGNGDLSILFTLHYNSDNTEIADGDIVDLGTPIYGKVLVEAAGFPFLDVHFESVVISQTNPASSPFTLVADGCGVATAQVDNVDCDNDEDDRFTMTTNGAFRYPGQLAGTDVYFFATVIVCLASDAASECQTECLAACPPVGRKRRDTVQESLRTKYYVQAGPYTIGDANKEAAVDKDEGEAFPSYVIAVLAVCGVVAIAIVSAVVLIVLRRRRQNTTIAEPRDTGVTA